MKSIDIPAKMNIPWANGAGGSYVQAIPQASQIGITAGRASLTDGFPPVTFQPTGSGGTPPFGSDMNGILKQITQWSRWQSAGALPIYDSAFATAIGGYPVGAILASTTAGALWLCITDDNTADPDSAGAGWVGLPSLDQSMGGATVQDVTGSRVFGTTYTNSTNRAIAVMANTPNNSSSAWGLTGFVSGISCQSAFVPASAAASIGITLVVPPGATYKITQSTGSPTLNKWVEIR